jgi:hypothetical protein
MKIVDGEPGFIAQFLFCILEKLDDWWYKVYASKRWTFGDKWNAMIEREDFESRWRIIQANWAKGLRGNGEP